jgi:hypothetical protein
MLSSALTAIATLALASATPIKEVSELATFDDIAAVPAVPELNPVGVYKGLNYVAFDVLVQGVDGILLTGVEPHSGDQVAANSITGDLTSSSGPAFIPASGYTELDLESLWFGCVVDSVASVTGVPEECTIAFTAYKCGSEVAYQTINQQYNPENLLKAPMTQAVFPSSWTGMGKIEIAIVQGELTSTLSALLIDDVKYNVY